MAPVTYQVRYSAGVQPLAAPSASEPAARAYQSRPRVHSPYWPCLRFAYLTSRMPTKTKPSTLVSAGSRTFGLNAQSVPATDPPAGGVKTLARPPIVERRARAMNLVA